MQTPSPRLTREVSLPRTKWDQVLVRLTGFAHRLGCRGRAWVFPVLVCALSLQIVSCNRKAPAAAALPDNVIAQVGSSAITREAFDAELQRRSRLSPGVYDTADNRRKLLDELIEFEVLLERARAAGYDRDPQIVSSLNRLIVAKYQEDQLDRAPEPRPSAEEKLAFYRTNVARFGTPELRRGAVLLIRVPKTASEGHKASLRAQAESLHGDAIARAGGDRFFGLLAHQHSEDQATRYAGGDTGWVRFQETDARWEAAVVKELFALKQPGEIAPLLTTPKGHYLVKLVEVKPAALKPFAEVEDGVEYVLSQEQKTQARNRFYQEQASGLAITLNTALLEASRPKQFAKSLPPRVPEN